MELKNGYKVIYENAAGGKRTFYASKQKTYPNKDDTKLGDFIDANYQEQMFYEHKGKFYVSKDRFPTYNESGIPTDTAVENFDKVLVEGFEEPVEAESTPKKEPKKEPKKVVEENTNDSAEAAEPKTEPSGSETEPSDPEGEPELDAPSE